MPYKIVPINPSRDSDWFPNIKARCANVKVIPEDNNKSING